MEISRSAAVSSRGCSWQRVNPRPHSSGNGSGRSRERRERERQRSQRHQINTFQFNFALLLTRDSEPESTQVIFVGHCQAPTPTYGDGRAARGRPAGPEAELTGAGCAAWPGLCWPARPGHSAGKDAACSSPSLAQPHCTHRAGGVSSPGHARRGLLRGLTKAPVEL